MVKLKKIHNENLRIPPQLTGGGNPENSIYINESGLYSLILSSKLQEAKKFKYWITRRDSS